MAAVPLLKKHLVTVDEYQRMAATGVFAADERLELLYGEIVEMTPIGDRHALCVMMICDFLVGLRPRVILNPQNPIRLPGQQAVPQPDVVLLRRRSDYRSRLPGPEDVLLLVEVAESSLSYDRDVKIPLYAKAGIPESWLADLNSDVILTFRKPSPEGYREVREYRRGDWISPEAFPDEQFLVDDLLG